MWGFKSKPDDGKGLTQPVPAGWEITDLGLLGQGGMSRVYRVRDQSLGREVALKVLRPELAREGAALERFIEEAKITAQLDHPNIPPLYALASERRRTTCFTMKVLEGITLQQMIERLSSRTVDALLPVLEVMVRVCDAVAFAHSRGILHCDLKPANVMVGEHGQIYVVDWGLARRKSSLPTKETDDHRAVGTPSYMAPEQARGQNWALDERTDVFALGGMLYRLLAGRPPYVAQTAEEVLTLAGHARILPVDQAAAKLGPVPGRLAAICMRALAVEPANRYPSAADLRRDLEAFIHGTARLPERTFAAGEAIVREGEPGDCAYIILDGHCQASKVVAGAHQALKLMGPGEMFGEAAVLTGSPRLATVTALMDTTVAVVARSFLQEEMERTSLMALAIRAVAGSFLDLSGQTTALLEERTCVQAVDFVLRELALKGRAGVDGSKWIAWAELLARAVAETGLSAETITERVSRQPGMLVDPQLDRLTLKVPAPR